MSDVLIYRPSTGSLAARLVGHFSLHPAQWLSVEQIVERFVFSGDLRNVHTQLAPACSAGLLQYSALAGLYCGGPVAPRSVLDQTDDPMDAASELEPSRRRRKPHSSARLTSGTPLDLAGVRCAEPQIQAFNGDRSPPPATMDGNAVPFVNLK